MTLLRRIGKGIVKTTAAGATTYFWYWGMQYGVKRLTEQEYNQLIGACQNLDEAVNKMTNSMVVAENSKINYEKNVKPEIEKQLPWGTKTAYDYSVGNELRRKINGINDSLDEVISYFQATRVHLTETKKVVADDMLTTLKGLRGENWYGNAPFYYIGAAAFVLIAMKELKKPDSWFLRQGVAAALTTPIGLYFMYQAYVMTGSLAAVRDNLKKSVKSLASSGKPFVELQKKLYELPDVEEGSNALTKYIRLKTKSKLREDPKRKDAVLDIPGKIHKVNQGAGQLLGYARYANQKYHDNENAHWYGLGIGLTAPLFILGTYFLGKYFYKKVANRRPSP